MMWQAAKPVDLAAPAATIVFVAAPVCARRALEWFSRGVSWQNG